MYGCFDAYVVYGVMEGDRSQILDQEWLESKYPYMNVFASDVVRNTMGNAVYGYSLDFDEATGQSQPTDGQKEDVQQLYTFLCEYCRRENLTEPSMGYFLVVSGDYCQDHSEYVPEEEH